MPAAKGFGNVIALTLTVSVIAGCVYPVHETYYEISSMRYANMARTSRCNAISQKNDLVVIDLEEMRLNVMTHIDLTGKEIHVQVSLTSPHESFQVDPDGFFLTTARQGVRFGEKAQVGAAERYKNYKGKIMNARQVVIKAPVLGNENVSSLYVNIDSKAIKTPQGEFVQLEPLEFRRVTRTNWRLFAINC